MATEKKHRTGFTFKVEELSDISIDLLLTKHATVEQKGGALHVIRAREPAAG